MNTTILTAAEYRAKAADEREKRAESFDRCDTDGFLSQWAWGVMAGRYEHNARVLDEGAVALVILDLAGKVIATKEYEGTYGTGFITTDEAVAAGFPRFVWPSKAQNRNRAVMADASKGFRRQWVRTTAVILADDGALEADRAAILSGDFEVIADTDDSNYA